MYVLHILHALQQGCTPYIARTASCNNDDVTDVESGKHAKKISIEVYDFGKKVPMSGPFWQIKTRAIYTYRWKKIGEGRKSRAR
jgi:hypothetical protein